MEPSTFAALLPIWILLLVILPAQRRRKRTILANKILNNELENKEMFELAKRFIEKECIIYAFDGNQYNGTIKEVTEGAILIEKKGSAEAINLNFVVKIKEIVKCKK
jgi:hypothetical protein